MSIKMKYGELSNTDFLNSLQFLANSKLPVKTAYNVKKLCDKILQARKKIAQEYTDEILKKHAKKNPDGSILLEDGKPTSYDIQDAVKLPEFQADEKAFSEKVFEIPCQKVFLEQLQSLDMTASQLSSLDPILTEMTVVAEPGQGPLRSVPIDSSPTPA